MKQYQAFFEGRIWERQQTIFPQEEIEQAIQDGYFTTCMAVQKEGQRYICKRCLNTNPHTIIPYNCAKCEQICVYCRHCITMGRMTSCTELLMWDGPENVRQTTITYAFAGQLTPLQQQASSDITASIERGEGHLLVAVCGAGKTEVLFEPVASALRAGKRVCVATPRTDVVLELFPRFQAVFPDVSMQALYGGAEVRTDFVQLIIATTHQLYRFHRAFDVVFVDEADAFPYTYDASLQKAVLKAKTDQAPVIFVTATPSAHLLQQVKQGKLNLSFIAKRYHNHPLPVPRYEGLFNYARSFQKGRIQRKLRAWVEQRLKAAEPFLIFFPTIELMEIATPLFKQICSDIAAVHAEDPDRKEKVLALRNEKLNGLLTTTILERGITIKNVQVAVVGAESGIFTASALIQISGRVGRNVDFPTGDIVFFHHGITVEMDAARAEIVALNRRGFGGE